MLITVRAAAESEERPSLPSLEVFLSGRRRRTKTKEAILLVKFLPLLTAASTCTGGLLGLHGAARETFPTLNYVTYNRN